jgi:phage tail-like protein
MVNQLPEVALRPFTAFNFSVELTLPDKALVCSASFAECDGLEMTMEPKTIREGGNNNAQIHLIGPVSYGQLTLKRGMTSTYDLWDWFDSVLRTGGHGLRASGEVVLLAADHETVNMRFMLTRCLPVKLKAPGLNAKEGAIAIEEMQIVYERLMVKRPSPSLSLSVSLSLTANI